MVEKYHPPPQIIHIPVSSPKGPSQLLKGFAHVTQIYSAFVYNSYCYWQQSTCGCFHNTSLHGRTIQLHSEIRPGCSRFSYHMDLVAEPRETNQWASFNARAHSRPRALVSWMEGTIRAADVPPSSHTVDSSTSER